MNGATNGSVPAGATVVETAARVRSGDVSASDVVSRTLSLVEQLNADLNAFVHIDTEWALELARDIDAKVARGVDPGPLAGVPMGVKELQAVAGWPCAMGSTLYSDRIADHTCTLVARAVAAGAVPIGVTASPEFGRASYTASALHGVTRNPWNTDLTPGGSSGGSAAAVAAGMVPMATGTDGAGSIRIPASYCGLVGFKATYGLVPRGPRHRGVADNDHYGVLTRTVADTARFLDCVCGVDDYDRASLPAPPFRYEDRLFATDLSELRVAFTPTLGNAPCDPRVAAVTESAAEMFIAATGARRVPVNVTVDAACGTAFRALSAPEVYGQVRAALPGRDMHPSVRRYVEAAEALGPDALVHAHETRAALVAEMAVAFEGFDLLLTPATQVPAFPAEGPMPTEIAGQPVDHWGALAVTFPFNLTGQPAISVPAGRVGGAPVGLQIVGRRHADALVLAAAAAFEGMA
ncbi:Acylamidase [Mycolicibacterium vanbaalenii]|uniref:amidase n=1 Tax=Mycolicibacterium vanbaalenii TaxID=110539 RepID=A0A5S9QIE4_MYCVN|nr:amidase [Mycolicibacterium vanbaalenii]CAA0117401.1 Acylamidase [Mycolicibacterium vanbaalenii]